MSIKSLLEKMDQLNQNTDSDKTSISESKNLPGNQERIDVAQPKGKITSADFKALRDKKKKSVEEDTKETKTGRVHKGSYGSKYQPDEKRDAYGHKIRGTKIGPDLDPEGDDKPAPVKRGRGRPKKGSDITGHLPKYDFAKDLQGFMVGNLPGGKLPGKPGKKHKLKDWIEHVEASMIAESQKLSEIALDPSQLAVPKVGGTTTQPTTASATTPAASATPGAAVIDFKNPQDPLKAALQKAIQQKQITVLGEDDLEKFEDMSDEQLIKHCHQMGLEDSCVTDGHGTLINRDEIVDLLKQHSDDKTLDEVAPKGWEGTVKDMKKHKDIDNPWALANWMKDQGYKSHKKESVNESYTFEDVIGRFPHEHKMCQEGWGMDESLYEALCDHYHKEGRIPYKVWHGPLEELRKYVEECYMKDTGLSIVVGEGDAGAIIGGMAGAALTKTPAGAMAGANLGSNIQDEFGESHYDKTLPESKIEQVLRGDEHSDGEVHEEYVGYKKLSRQLADKGAEDPAALAAWIGRKKYGKSKFQKDAASGKKLGENVKQRDIQLESWETQLRSALNEYNESAQTQVVSDTPQPEQSIGAEELMSLIRHAGLTSADKKSHDSETPSAKLDGSEIQSGVAYAVNDTETEPGSDDPRNDVIAGQIFVPQLPMPRGMGMSVEGDTHVHDISVAPHTSDEVQATLASDSEQHSDADAGEDILAIIKRMIADRQSSSQQQSDAKLIVPASDYAQEVSEGQTQTASPGDAHMSPLSEEDDETFGYRTGTPSAAKHANSTTIANEDEVEEGAGVMHYKAQQAKKAGKDSFTLGGKEFPVKEDEQSEEDSEALASEADRDAALANAYAADNYTNRDVNIEEEALDQPATMEGEEVCNECGGMMYEGHACEGKDHDHDDAQKLDEWANSPVGKSEDEQFKTDMEFMTKLLSGGLNGMKRNQSVMPSTEVYTRGDVRDEHDSMMELLNRMKGKN